MILVIGAAAASLISTGLSAGISFTQGLRERKLMREAQKESQVLLREAEGFLKKNQYENLSVPKQDIALARANVDARNQNTMEALQQQGARGVLGGAGALSASQQAMELDLLKTAEGREFAKQKLVLDEEAQTDEQLASMKLRGAEDANFAAADSFAMMNAYFGDAATSGLAALTTGLTSPDLFKGDKEKLDDKDETKKYVNPLDKDGNQIPDIMEKNLITGEPLKKETNSQKTTNQTTNKVNQPLVDAPKINTTNDNSYDYKLEGGKYFYSEKGKNNWIEASGKGLDSIIKQVKF